MTTSTEAVIQARHAIIALKNELTRVQTLNTDLTQQNIKLKRVIAFINPDHVSVQ